MNNVAYFKSLTQELEALRDRVRNLIDDRHWLSDGEWKESVIRSVLASRLPDSIKIGRGFIVGQDWASTQCDVLLYKADSPVLFRESEFVILPSDAVLGVLEVKTNVDAQSLRVAVEKLAAIGPELPMPPLLGLFSYKSSIKDDLAVLKTLQAVCDRWNNRLQLLCLGCNTFVKWWDCPPNEDLEPGKEYSYQKWHTYKARRMAAGYFLTHVIDVVCPNRLFWDSNLWYPTTGREVYKTGEIEFRSAQE